MFRNLGARFSTAITALVGAGIALVLLLLYLQVDPPAGKYDDADIQRLADQRIEAITPSPPIEPEIFNLVRPSVVTIFREPPNSGAADRGLGSGVVVDEFGNILTAYHVIQGKTQVSVRFADGSVHTGTVDKEQPERDLAVVHVEGLPDGVTAATLAGGVRPGDEVLAFGSPFGLEGTLTSGVVSSLGRTFIVNETGQVLTDMIQFDAAVNPGSSGGPLVDAGGRVVGIVTGIVNPTQDSVFVGMGFAVPIESASGVFPPVG